MLAAEPGLRELERFGTIARDLSELKRFRDQSSPHSVAERLFRLAWRQLCAGATPADLWMPIAADALVGTRLAGLDDGLLRALDVEDSERAAILLRSFDDAAADLSHERMAPLRARIGKHGGQEPAPGFVDALIRQPRAGATSPGKPRLTLLPAESHADHCLVVAVLGALIALHDDADPGRVFVAGLAHHLHNAALPDTGFAGEVMLGPTLETIMRRLFSRELATLPRGARTHVGDALPLIAGLDTAEGRAFNAADVIDRVLQAHHHARAAAFTAGQALDDLELVHEGPLRPFQSQVLAVLGLV